ncbi:MAG TPA: filamentous hemagglutinin N-terminal domain-containing protein, partial [Vicinamibacterales bacterium]
MNEIDQPAWRGARRGRARGFPRQTATALAVAACFASGTALPNPTGPTVAHGTAAIHQAGNLTQITNSPNAIINWQSFSIAAGEVTRFLQQSAASAVLNRVTGQNPSQILGALQSNGRVFLINPSGILFGAGAQIDVAGLVASTLNLSDSDFLSGRLRFMETPGAGSVVNQGAITTPSGGNVYLVGPAVTNNGIITSPQGEVVLAAGNRVELVNPATPNLRVEITAPDNQALNLGHISADAGRVGIYAGLINQRGTISADSAVIGENGSIVLRATRNTTLDAGSTTTANGPSGGTVTIQSGDTTMVLGAVEAKGSEGIGGAVQVLGNLVGLTGNASIDASGETGGGTVLVGGDFQGKNPDVQNAFRTYVGPDATIKADAGANGDGGKVIVWADDITRYYGTISARGGAQAGDGGFVEVSGSRYLDFNGSVNTSAPRGNYGTLLLDPTNIEVVTGGTATLAQVDEFADADQVSTTCVNLGGAACSKIDPLTINAAGSNVVLQAKDNILFTNAISITTPGVGLTATTQEKNITVNASITTAATGTSGVASGSVTLTADKGAIALNADITTGNASVADVVTTNQTAVSGGITLSAGTGVTGSGRLITGNAQLTGASATGTDSATSGGITVSAGTVGTSGGIGLSATNALTIGTATRTTAVTDSATAGNIVLSSVDEINNGTASKALNVTLGTASGASSNSAGSLSVTTTSGAGNVYVTTTGPLLFSASTVGGNLDVLAGEGISQSGTVAVTGTSRFVSTGAGLGGRVLLDGGGNSFGGQVTLQGTELRIRSDPGN